MSKPTNKSYLLTQFKNFKTEILDPLFLKKINEPTTEGTNGQVLTTNGNGVRTWTTTKTIQVQNMPIPSESYLGKIYQYVGETTNNYINGYFYKCIEGEPEVITFPNYNEHNWSPEYKNPFELNSFYFEFDIIQSVSNGAWLYLDSKQTEKYPVGHHRVTIPSGTKVAQFNGGPVRNMMAYANVVYVWERLNVQPGSDLSNYYTKTEVDNALEDKANQDTTYTKTEVDALIPDITELEEEIESKADQDTTYTKTEVDNLLEDKADQDELLYKKDFYETTESELDETVETAEVGDLIITSDGVISVDSYTKAETDSLLDEKQDLLPEIVNDKFLHTNATTGELEWTEVESSGEIKFKDTISSTNQPYLYTGHSYANPDWDKINEFMEDKFINGSCSGMVKDGKLYRSFDFLYNDTATIAIKNTACGYKGVAGAKPEITKAVIDNCEDDEWFDYLPFSLLDGINLNGIAVSTYIIHREGTRTDQGNSKQRICSSALNAYLLCNLSDIDDLADVVDGICLYMPSKPEQFSAEYHWLISNGTKTVCLEYIDNEAVITDITENPYITNFYLANWDGSDLSTTNAHAQGIERWNILKNGGSLEDVAYTHTYSLVGTDDVWRSEFNDVWSDSIDITTSTPDDDPDLLTVQAASKAAWESRTRGNGTWHTQHACIYDFATRSFKVCTQENYNDWYPEGNNLEEEIKSKANKADIELLESLIRKNWQRSGYNLLRIDERNISTKNGIQFELYSDGTIELSGTATDDTIFYLHTYIDLYYESDYIALISKNALPEGMSINISDAGRDIAKIYGTHNIDIIPNPHGNSMSVNLIIEKGTTINYETFYLMVVEANATTIDSVTKYLYPTEFQGYAQGNIELTENITRLINKEVKIGIGTYSAGSSMCNIRLNLLDKYDYTIKMFVSNPNVKILNYSYDSYDRTLSVYFNTQSSAGTITVEARKVGE